MHIILWKSNVVPTFELQPPNEELYNQLVEIKNGLNKDLDDLVIPDSYMIKSRIGRDCLIIAKNNGFIKFNGQKHCIKKGIQFFRPSICGYTLILCDEESKDVLIIPIIVDDYEKYKNNSYKIQQFKMLVENFETLYFHHGLTGETKILLEKCIPAKVDSSMVR